MHRCLWTILGYWISLSSLQKLLSWSYLSFFLSLSRVLGVVFILSVCQYLLPRYCALFHLCLMSALALAGVCLSQFSHFLFFACCSFLLALFCCLSCCCLSFLFLFLILMVLRLVLVSVCLLLLVA